MRLLDMSASMCAGSGNSSASAREGGTSERPTSVPKPNGAGKQSNLNKKVSYSTMSALLEPFSGKNGGSIPISSRAGADIAEQKTANRIGLLESWRYIPFLTHQGEFICPAMYLFSYPYLYLSQRHHSLLPLFLIMFSGRPRRVGELK